MSFTTPYSTQSSMWPPQDGEEPKYVPQVNTGFLDALADSSTFEATTGYYQSVELEAWLILVQKGQQPDFPPNEASITEFYYIMKEDTVTLTLYPQTQSQGIGGHFTTHSATKDKRNPSRAMGCTGKPRPACAYCSKDFGRIQELERHVKDIHTLKHKCHFCPFMWTRPGKLKDHLIFDHPKSFSPEVLERIKTLRGRELLKFLDEYFRRPDVGATSQPMVQAPLVPGVFPV